MQAGKNPATADELKLALGYKNVEPVYGNEPSEVDGLVHSLRREQNYIDTAELYGAGYTNKIIGQAIATVAHTIPREGLFISGNVWKSSYGQVRQAVERMLEQLNIDYLDVAGPHSPHTRGWDSPVWQATMPAFRQLVDEGLVRGLSVSNFTIGHMKEAIELAGVPITTAQMGFSAGYQSEVTEEFRAYCAGENIQIVAYQPLKPDLVRDDLVKSVAAMYGATPAQVALAWTIQKGALPIPKTVNPEHIEENLGAVNLLLNKTEMQVLSELDRDS